MSITITEGEIVPIEDLQPHPDNYRVHPQDQIDHICRSIKSAGFYRNVVVSSDGYILAGHGVVIAAKQLAMECVPVVVIDAEHDSKEAYRVLVGDNYIQHMAKNSDRQLTEILKALVSEEDDPGGVLLGTGFDPNAVAALAMVTRTADEIETVDDAAEWLDADMPDFEPEEPRIKLVLSFDTERERQALIEKLGIVIAKKSGKVSSAWYPPREKEDLKSVRVEEEQVDG